MSDSALIHYAKLVQQMRKEQRQYFATRDTSHLSLSKELERRVDAETQRLLEGQKELFPESTS